MPEPRPQAAHTKLADAVLEWLQQNPPRKEEPREQYRNRLAQMIAQHSTPIGVQGLRRMIDETTGEETGEGTPLPRGPVPRPPRTVPRAPPRTRA